MPMNPRRLFVASCIALITSAFSFMIRQNIADPLAADFALTKQDIGTVMGAAFLGMAVAMIALAPLCDYLGMGRVLGLAWLCHFVGIMGTIFSPSLTRALEGSLVPGTFATSSSLAFWILSIATFLVGSGNGLVEIAINPLAATLYPRQKTHYLNILHAWWPGGLIMSGLLATFLVNPILGLNNKDVPQDVASLGWKVKMALLLVPLAIYGILAVGQKFPVTERVQANVSTQDMFKEGLRPMFLLWAFCMLLTASTELGPNQWQESVLTRTARVSGTLVFVYTSGLMFMMRFFAGPLAHRFSPIGMLTGSALLSAVGLYWLSVVDNPVMAFVAATVFGVGIAYFWPTMLGVTAERFPKGGALLLGLMGSIGNLAIWQALPIMGGIYDSYTVHSMPAELQAKRFVDSKGQPLTGTDGKPLVEPVLGPDGKPVLGPDGKPKEEPLALVKEEGSTWMPQFLAQYLYPAGSKKLNPEATRVLDAARTVRDEDEQGKLPDDSATRTRVEDARKILDTINLQAVRDAETEGARYAFRLVAVLPCILVVIFGILAISDRLRGGYKAVHISEVEKEPEATPL
jgi:MFS family permease